MSVFSFILLFIHPSNKHSLIISKILDVGLSGMDSKVIRIGPLLLWRDWSPAIRRDTSKCQPSYLFLASVPFSPTLPLSWSKLFITFCPNIIFLLSFTLPYLSFTPRTAYFLKCKSDYTIASA